MSSGDFFITVDPKKLDSDLVCVISLESWKLAQDTNLQIIHLKHSIAHTSLVFFEAYFGIY